MRRLRTIVLWAAAVVVAVVVVVLVAGLLLPVRHTAIVEGRYRADAAAVYGASEGLKTLILDRHAPGGHLEVDRGGSHTDERRHAVPAASRAGPVGQRDEHPCRGVGVHAPRRAANVMAGSRAGWPVESVRCALTVRRLAP